MFATYMQGMKGAQTGTMGRRKPLTPDKAKALL